MWQEARKHERKLRGMMVDYKRRGERRREYYEKIKKDPAQFLQVHGRAYKIHLDPAVALAAESPINMMPWQGDTSNMIDRFDVRAHLDYIPVYNPSESDDQTPEQEMEERKCNYERYRGLVQNDFANISEEQCLYQIYLDELYGGLPKPNEDEKKKLAEKKASIGYIYEDSTVTQPEPQPDKEEDDSENSESEEDEGIPDIDVEVDVDELNEEQLLDLNKIATPYGMAEGDFVRMLRKDKEEVEAIKHAKALEAEKAMYSGRRSRRQRREFREKRLKGRQISPPSYARRDSPTYDPYKRPESESSSESRSRSRTPGPEKITFITSFGGSDDEAPVATLPAAPQSGHNASNLPHPAGHSRGSRRRQSSSSRSRSSSDSSSNSSSRSSSHSRRGRRDRGRDRNRSRSYSRSRRRSRSHSRSKGSGSWRRRDRTRSRSNDRDRERDRDRRRYSSHRRSRSRSDSRQHGASYRGSRSSRGNSRSESPSRPTYSPSPPHRGVQPSATSVSDKLRKPDTVGGKETGAAKVKMTPQERLKLRMQKALNKQSKADKKAAQVKIQQQEHKRQEREGELRAMARKIRMKERERRERERDEWERQYGRDSHSPSPSKHSREHSSHRRRSRSRSRSPYYRH
ncbi:CLK4-associating serine/arginine rich protein isoform X1 [Periophthalmus magnuspinnatus]|uniref:CLK4-associating serine/arginine rich protein isoform X1 n=1 Tax=Periophthalmus magnuspinnatus TaxID=409849 RepID=UPI00145B57DC|nr:CLK4-associating serine/arginine rich protein isoform X1 [Periophthalmus magnuspinnatus]XP_055082122.1 CLK4-associating serine/arginine rich protein isoform X1 [Periophthalmus magnuspinnatus]